MKISRKTIIFLVLLCMSLNIFAQESDILRTIEFLEENPVHDDSGKFYGQIITFAKESDKIDIFINLETMMPWMNSKIHDKWKAYLFGSYFTGNVKQQLIMKTKKDSPFQGYLFVINTYENIKAKEKDFFVEEIEYYINLKKRDKFEEYVLSLSK